MKQITQGDATQNRTESNDPGYLAWKKKKIEAALKHADDHPNGFLTEQEIWQKHGLDY